MATEKDPPKTDPTDPPAGDDANEEQWSELEKRTKKATREAMDEWFTDKSKELKKSGGLAVEVDFGPLGFLFGGKPKAKQ